MLSASLNKTFLSLSLSFFCKHFNVEHVNHIYVLTSINGSDTPTMRPETDKADHLSLGRTLMSSKGARCSSMVREFARGAMGHRIDPSWCGPIELFLVPASAP